MHELFLENALTAGTACMHLQKEEVLVLKEYYQPFQSYGLDNWTTEIEPMLQVTWSQRGGKDGTKVAGELTSTKTSLVKLM